MVNAVTGKAISLRSVRGRKRRPRGAFGTKPKLPQPAANAHARDPPMEYVHGQRGSVEKVRGPDN